METLTRLADDLWVATRPLPLSVGDIGTRMTVVRLADGGLWLHSPVALDPATRQALDALGPVRCVVAPSKVHHFYVGAYETAYPQARLFAAPGLPEKKREVAFHAVLDADRAEPEWAGQIEQHLFAGAALMNEVVFYHSPSRTLLLTDLAFNMVRPPAGRARLFCWIMNASGQFGPHRLVRFGIRDRRAARASVERILGWDFDRVIVTHGDVLERGGHDHFARAFAYLREA